MLKINSQLGRTLRYQAELGTERQLGHFDDTAADLMGPPTIVGIKPFKGSGTKSSGSIPSNLRAKRDSTGNWVVSYADDGDR